MSNTLEFANEFTCPKCCERLRVDRAVPPEPVPDEPREFVRYVWNVGIKNVVGGGDRLVIPHVDRLALFTPDFVVWNSCGTAQKLRDAATGVSGIIADQATQDWCDANRELITSGAFMRIQRNGIDGEISRWDRCHVKHIVWNSEARDEDGGWVLGYDELKQHVGPGVEFIMGNVGWGPGYHSQEYAERLRTSGDSLEHYYRGYGRGRHWLNFKWRCAFMRAVCDPVGKKFYVGVQPWNDQGLGSNPLFDYSASLAIVAAHADGILGWAWDSMTDEQIELWNNQQVLPRPTPTRSIILIGDERQDAALFRIAHWAGLECEAVLEGDEPRLPVFYPLPADEEEKRRVIGHIVNFHNGVIGVAEVDVIEKAIAAAWLEAVK